ncbi:uncharacterized protein VTP21DRAFT_11002 [Calcarisporiella thermophila]|uniref:uncharacterized protein n=1 Tax=Calcarisporiella thermophila TaxID=911321 RepID=UPI0037424A54
MAALPTTDAAAVFAARRFLNFAAEQHDANCAWLRSVFGKDSNIYDGVKSYECESAMKNFVRFAHSREHPYRQSEDDDDDDEPFQVTPVDVAALVVMTAVQDHPRYHHVVQVAARCIARSVVAMLRSHHDSAPSLASASAISIEPEATANDTFSEYSEGWTIGQFFWVGNVERAAAPDAQLRIARARAAGVHPHEDDVAMCSSVARDDDIMRARAGPMRGNPSAIRLTTGADVPPCDAFWADGGSHEPRLLALVALAEARLGVPIPVLAGDVVADDDMPSMGIDAAFLVLMACGVLGGDDTLDNGAKFLLRPATIKALRDIGAGSAAGTLTGAPDGCDDIEMVATYALLLRHSQYDMSAEPSYPSLPYKPLWGILLEPSHERRFPALTSLARVADMARNVTDDDRIVLCDSCQYMRIFSVACDCADAGTCEVCRCAEVLRSVFWQNALRPAGETGFAQLSMLRKYCWDSVGGSNTTHQWLPPPSCASSAVEPTMLCTTAEPSVPLRSLLKLGVFPSTVGSLNVSGLPDVPLIRPEHQFTPVYTMTQQLVLAAVPQRYELAMVDVYKPCLPDRLHSVLGRTYEQPRRASEDYTSLKRETMEALHSVRVWERRTDVTSQSWSQRYVWPSTIRHELQDDVQLWLTPE